MISWGWQVQPHPAVADTALDTGETIFLHLGEQHYTAILTSP
jgi:hypothetical protein